MKDYESNVNKEVYFKKMIEPGIEIILTYNTEFILANVNNVKTIQEFNRVVYFIEFAIDFYKKYKSKKIDKKYNTYFSEVVDFANQYDKINKIDEEELEKNNIEDELELDDLDLDDLFSETYDSVTNVSVSKSDAIKDTPKVKSVSAKQKQVISLQDLTDSSDLSSLEGESSSSSKKQKGGGKEQNFSRYYSKRLGESERDPTLFKWKASDYPDLLPYSKLCTPNRGSTGARQPVVINDDELDRINN